MDDAVARRDGKENGHGTLNTPFRELRKLIPGSLPAARKPPARASRAAPAKPPGDGEDDESLFLAAAHGAVPLPPEERNVVPGRPPTPAGTPYARRADLEALQELAELVNGGGSFELSDTEEHVEGWVVGLDPRVLQRLRAGEFAHQAHVDLHGFTADEARTVLRQFVLRALRAGYRCVLVVHGRGRNSRDRRPVLKEGVKSWLSRGELAQVVLAFATARPCDGGAGAMYVLLRRQRRNRKPFETLSGAKRS